VLLDGSVSVRQGGDSTGGMSSFASMTAYGLSLTRTSLTTGRSKSLAYGFPSSDFGGWHLNVLISSTLSQYNQYIAMIIKRDCTRSSSSVYGGYIGEYSNAVSFTTSRYCSLSIALYDITQLTASYISTNVVSGFYSTSGGTNSSQATWGPNVMDYQYYNVFNFKDTNSVFPTSLTISRNPVVNGPMLYIY
jgi:hypothetical protein